MKHKFFRYLTVKSLDLKRLDLMKRILYSFAGILPLVIAFSSLRAQSSDDNNVVIKTRTERYDFAQGTVDHPVVINQQFNTVYRCDGYRTTVPYVEFYDDQSTIGEVAVFVDGKKARYIKPSFEYYSVESIFYSDARVCHFQFPLEKKGSETEVQLSKTVTDPRYFTTIYFTEPQKIESKQVIISVPSWMQLEIKEMNFAGSSIKKQTEKKGDATIYTYNIQQLPARKSEPRSPGPSYIYPHLLLLSKSASLATGKVTYFNTLDDQYAWYRQLVKEVDNDKAAMKEKASEITKGISDDLAKIKAIYSYVQDNIRYIAFEDGLAGFRPEKAQNVLNKKYGDCKGMANLTKELLVASGFDARLCWIGTNHIAYDYSTPSMSVDNHMICALDFKGKLYFLDATETYIGFDQYAERIQGRQVLIENGDKYLLERVPLRPFAQNMDYEKRILQINGNDLSGMVEHKWQGESKEWLLQQIHGLKKDKLTTALESYLSENDRKYAISELHTSDLNERNDGLDIKYQLSHKESVSGFGDELYVEMDFRKDMSNAEINVENRNNDWLFPYKQHLVYETELALPKGYKISELPAALNIEDPSYDFKLNYKIAGEKLIYRKEINIKETRLRKNAFEKWNNSIKQLKKYYNQQITLTKN